MPFPVENTWLQCWWTQSFRGPSLVPFTSNKTTLHHVGCKPLGLENEAFFFLPSLLVSKTSVFTAVSQFALALKVSLDFSQFLKKKKIIAHPLCYHNLSLTFFFFFFSSRGQKYSYKVSVGVKTSKYSLSPGHINIFSLLINTIYICNPLPI